MARMKRVTQGKGQARDKSRNGFRVLEIGWLRRWICRRMSQLPYRGCFGWDAARYISITTVVLRCFSRM